VSNEHHFKYLLSRLEALNSERKQQIHPDYLIQIITFEKGSIIKISVNRVLLTKLLSAHFQVPFGEHILQNTLTAHTTTSTIYYSGDMGLHLQSFGTHAYVTCHCKQASYDFTALRNFPVFQKLWFIGL
jgi:hypothetical protein